MTSTAVSAALMRQIARGERPSQAPRTLGVSTDPDAGEAGDIPPLDVSITADDLALGFVVHLENPQELRRWAFVLQAAPCDFSAVQAVPDGELLLDALWQASFGDPLDAAAVARIKELARRA